MWCHNLEVVSLHNVVSELGSGFFTQRGVRTQKWFNSLHNVVSELGNSFLTQLGVRTWKWVPYTT